VFSGRFDHAIDEKGRVSIPARFREKLSAADFLYVTNFRSDRQPCLRLYTPDEWDRLLGRLKQKPSFNPDIQRFQLFFIGGAHDVPIDVQGRILIPPKLREFARLERDVTFSGMSEHFELWDRDTLNKVLEKAEATFDDPERMKEIDL
jgi:MraZ protein